MTGFALHPEAYDDIDEIRSYIADYSPDAADRVVDEIFVRLGQLAQFPEQGFRRPDVTSLPLRFGIVREYLIAYAPGRSPMWVVAVSMGGETRVSSLPCSEAANNLEGGMAALAG